MGDNEFGGAWSADKLDKVQEYISAYLTAMSRQRWDLVYIDAFAGSGYQILKQSRGIERNDSLASFFQDELDEDAEGAADYILGSAMRAVLESEKQRGRGHAAFSQFVFMDKDGNAIETLRSHVEDEIPSALERCHFLVGDANEKMGDVLAEIDWSKTRGITFLDPYNLSIRKETLEAIAHTYALDVWFLFPLMATTRVMKRSGVPENWKGVLDGLYGDRGWEKAIYREQQVLTLFDDEPHVISERSRGVQDILAYTTDWLGSIFSDVSTHPRILKTGRGTLMFALYAAISSRSDAAVRLWKNISQHILAS